MASVRHTVTLTLAFVVCVLVAAGVAATPGVAVGESPAATAAQDPSDVEVSLALPRSTRRLIQQGLRNEGFDPGTPDGLFGPRTRAAIREWQQSRGMSPTGYLNDAEAELLRTAAAPPPAAPEAPPPPETVPAIAPTASSDAAASAPTPTESDSSPASPATVAAEEVDPQNAAVTNARQGRGALADTVRANSQPSGSIAPSPPSLRATAVREASPAQASAVSCGNWNTEEFFETATVEEVTACLGAGADVAAQDADGITPLHWAAWSTDHATVIDGLLAAGANLEARNDNLPGTPFPHMTG